MYGLYLLTNAFALAGDFDLALAVSPPLRVRTITTITRKEDGAGDNEDGDGDKDDDSPTSPFRGNKGNEGNRYWLFLRGLSREKFGYHDVRNNIPVIEDS